MKGRTGQLKVGCSQSDRLISHHALSDKTETGYRGHEYDKVIELSICSSVLSVVVLLKERRTAFLEYSLSSASVRASTNRRRRFGKLDGFVLSATSYGD
jgi:hypothetical protein